MERGVLVLLVPVGARSVDFLAARSPMIVPKASWPEARCMGMGLLRGQEGRGSELDCHQSTQRAALGTTNTSKAFEGHKVETSKVGLGHIQKNLKK